MVQFLRITQSLNLSTLFSHHFIILVIFFILSGVFLGLLQPNPLYSWAVISHFPFRPPILQFLHLHPSLILAPQVPKSLFLINRYHHSPILRAISPLMVILSQGVYRRGYPAFICQY